ncbi:MAG TPA: hypothetical protein VFT61_01730 [Sphingomicrobium sp.]|nr:hypothetical protein [Sphingomicrobium sp.]
MIAEFYGLEFDLPDGWEDITQPDGPPALARPDGIGAIQFSFASRTDGVRITLNDLRTEATEFGEETGRIFEHRTERSGEIDWVCGRSTTDGELFALWLLTNGSDLVFVTYNCLEPRDPKAISEMRDAERIVSSMSF